MPIAFYTLVDASANDAAQGKVGGLTCFGLSTPGDEPPVGESYLVAEIELTLLALDEAGGEAPPLVPDEVICPIEISLIAEDSAHTDDSCSGDILIVATGFSVLPNEDVFIADIEVDLVAGSPAPFEDSIFHVERAPVMMGAIGIFVDLLDESLSLGATGSGLQISVLRARLGLHGAPLSQADAHTAVLDEIAFAETMFSIQRILVESGIAFGATETVTLTRINAVVEVLMLSGAVTSAADAITLIIEAIALAGAADLVNRERISEALGFSAAAADALTAAETLVDALLLTDVVVGQGRMTMLVEEGLGFADTTLTQARAVSLLRDGLGFALTFALDDGNYIATVINTKTKGITQYENYPFNSFACIGGAYYGMTPDGIRRLEGPDDAGEARNWRMRLARTNLSSAQIKRMQAAYLGYTATGEIRLKVIVQNKNDGLLEQHNYRLLEQPASSARAARLKIGQGLAAEYWAFGLESIDGGEFGLDLLDLHPINIDKIMNGRGGGRR